MRLAQFVPRFSLNGQASLPRCRPWQGACRPWKLRDHARPILEAIAKDLFTPQTGQEQLDNPGVLPRLTNS